LIKTGHVLLLTRLATLAVNFGPVVLFLSFVSMGVSVAAGWIPVWLCVILYLVALWATCGVWVLSNEYPDHR